MDSSRKIALLSGLALVLAMPAGLSLAAVEAITRPSKDVTLSFIRPGQIKEVLVKAGDRVKAGAPLLQQEDDPEQSQLAYLKAQAEDTTRLEAAQARLDQSGVDLRKTEKAHKEGGATALELDHAKLDVTIARLTMALSRFQMAQDVRKYREAGLRVAQMRMNSPIDGRVEQIGVEAGESVNELEKIVRVVYTGLLWIDAPVPLADARSLKAGGRVKVEFPRASAGASAVAWGKIVHVASVADPASNTLLVRVEVANPGSRPAGEHVRVTFVSPTEQDGPAAKAGPSPSAPGVKSSGESVTAVSPAGESAQQE